MRLFGKKKTSRRARKNSTDRTAVELVRSKINNNPTIEAAVLTKHFGIPINPADLKPEPPVEKFRRKVFDLADESVSQNEDLKQRAIDAAFGELESTSQAAGGRRRLPYWRRGAGKGEEVDNAYIEPYPAGSSLEETLNNLDLLEARFGRQQPGLFQAALQPGGVGTELLKLLTTIMGGKGVRQLPSGSAQMTAPGGNEMIAVEVDGNLVEMTRAGYEIYKKQREELLRLKAGAPDVPAAASKSEPTATKTAEEGVAAGLAPPSAENAEQVDPRAESGLPPAVREYIESNIAAFTTLGQAIVEEIANPPEQYVNRLKGDARNGDLSTMVILDYLKSHTVDQVFETLELFSSFPALAPYVQKLKENRPWVEGVLANIQSD